MKRIAGLLLLTTLPWLAHAQPTATARIASDNIGIEFIFDNPGTQAYVCDFAMVDVQYNAPGNPRFPAQVEDLYLAPASSGLLVKQPQQQLAALKNLFGDQISAASLVDGVKLSCSPDQSDRVFALVIDNRSACGDTRHILMNYQVDLKVHKISVTSPPTPLARTTDELFVHDQGLATLYSLHRESPRQLAALTIGADGISYLNTLDLPPPPSGLRGFNNMETLLPLIGMTLLDRETLLLAYQPGAKQTTTASNSLSPHSSTRLYLDLISLEPDTGALISSRRTSLKFALLSDPELFVGRSAHTPDRVKLYFASPPINRSSNGLGLLSNTPVDQFTSPHKDVLTQQSVVRVNAQKTASGWQFDAAKLGDNLFFNTDGDSPVLIYNSFAHADDFSTSGATTQTLPAASLGIDNLVIERTGEKGEQALKVWSLPARGAPVVSQTIPAGLCDARLIAIDKRIYTAGELDINAQDAAGKTRLHYLVELGNPDKLINWLAKGPALDIRDASQKTPLMLAVEKNRGDLLAALLRAGARFDLKAPDSAGQLIDPLMHLTINGCDSCIQPLLDRQIPFGTVINPLGKQVPFKQMFCDFRAQDQFAILRMRPPEDTHMPAAFRQRVEETYAAWLASDPPLIRRERMGTALNINCQQP